MTQGQHRATARVLDILESLSGSEEGLTLTELSQALDAPKSSLFPIELERNGRKPVYLFVDESRAFSLKADDKIQVRRSKHTVRLVRLSERSFCEIFAQKMLPGGFEDEK